MKDLRCLAILILMALLVSCDLTRASAPAALVIPVAQPTSLPHTPPAEPAPIVRPRLVPPGLQVEGAIPDSVLERFYALAYLYPDVAKRTTKIVARRVVKGWIISYEAKVIYVNVWYTADAIADKLTEQFARRAYDLLKRQAPGTAKAFRTWKAFAAWLATGVR